MKIEMCIRKAVRVCSLLALMALLSAAALAQAANEAGELYAGIEIGSKGVKATAIRVRETDEGYSVKLIYAEVVNTTIMQLKDNKFALDVIRDTVLAVNKLMVRMRDELKVPETRIHIVGSSGLRADNPQDLVKAVRDRFVVHAHFKADGDCGEGILHIVPSRHGQLNAFDGALRPVA